MDCTTPGPSVLHYLTEFAQLNDHQVSDIIQPSPPLSSPSPPPFHLLSISVFSREVALPIRWPKYWSFSYISSPSNEYSGFISFRIDWFDLLAVQGTFKIILQHHSLKASIFQCSAPLGMNWDHSVVFEVEPKYCILDFFIDYEGYFISSKGSLPTTVIWIKFAHSHPLIPKVSVFTLAISCLTMSNLPWFTDLIFQVPVQYRLHFHPQIHPWLSVISALAQPLLSFWSN